MGEQGGLRTGWLAAFGTEGYEGEPPLLEELGVNFGHIKGKVRPSDSASPGAGIMEGYGRSSSRGYRENTDVKRKNRSEANGRRWDVTWR